MEFKTGATIFKTYEGKVMGQYWFNNSGKYITAESINGKQSEFKLTSAATAWLKYEFEKATSQNQSNLEKQSQD